jgi:hypothetical protein
MSRLSRAHRLSQSENYENTKDAHIQFDQEWRFMRTRVSKIQLTFESWRYNCCGSEDFKVFSLRSRIRLQIAPSEMNDVYVVYICNYQSYPVLDNRLQ